MSKRSTRALFYVTMFFTFSRPANRLLHGRRIYSDEEPTRSALTLRPVAPAKIVNIFCIRGDGEFGISHFGVMRISVKPASLRFRTLASYFQRQLGVLHGFSIKIRYALKSACMRNMDNGELGFIA